MTYSDLICDLTKATEASRELFDAYVHYNLFIEGDSTILITTNGTRIELDEHESTALLCFIDVILSHRKLID